MGGRSRPGGERSEAPKFVAVTVSTRVGTGSRAQGVFQSSPA